MASGPAYYPPAPRRSLVGPLLLIAIGLLFLLRNFGYSIPLFSEFVRYWPLLLVLVGVIRLVEFLAARNSDRPIPVMSGGSIFLLIILVCAGTALSAIYHSRNDINWGSLRDNLDMDDDFVHMFGNEYTFDGDFTQGLPAGGSIRVTSERGDVSVNTWDNPEVKVVYHKKVFAGSQHEADSANGKTQPRVQVQGNLVDVDANNESGGDRGISTNIDIYAPAKVAVEVNSSRGDVAVAQRIGDLKINSQRGDVTLDQITGNVSLTTGNTNLTNKHGSLHASNLTGNLNADGKLDDLTLDSVTGAVMIGADIYGDMHLSRLQKGVTIRTSRTELQFARIDGNLTMDSGSLAGEDLQGPVTVTTRAKDVELKNLKGDLRVNDDSGDITFENPVASVLGNLDLTTHHGDVHLSLPPKAGFQYQLSTKHGDISSEFENVHANSETGASSASGVIGRPAVKITVNSDTGDIALSKSENTIPAPPAPPEVSEPPAAPQPPSAKPPKGHKRVNDVNVM